MTFNPNELILEKIRSVEEYDLATNALVGRYTQIESPSLKTAATGTAAPNVLSSLITFTVVISAPAVPTGTYFKIA